MYRLLQEKVSVGDLLGLATGDSSKYGKAIADTVKSARDGYNSASGKNTNSLKTYSYSSAAAAASKLIAVFPVITSRTVSKDTTNMISRYIEQKGCVILQLALQAANISNAKNGMEYLRNFHQNLNIGGNGIDVLGQMLDKWIQGYQNASEDSTKKDDKHVPFGSNDIQENNTKSTNESTSISMSLYHEDTSIIDDSEVYESDNSIKLSVTQMNELMQLFKEAEDLVFYDTKLNPISINDFIVNENAGDYHVSIRRYPLTEDQNSDIKHRQDRNSYKDSQSAKHDDSINDEEDRLNKTLRRVKDTTSILKDQDIKKMNNAVPSLLIVKFYSSTDARVSTEFIIGVKSKVVGCNSDEILRRITNDNKDSKGFLNFIRALTGELKMGDLIFGLSRINDDLKSVKKKGAQGDTWTLLQNRAMAAKDAMRRGGINDFAAITTVVISKEDAEELFREENLDILDPKSARHFMQSYNLLGFIVADDSTESLHMMFDDGDNYFDEVSYMSLERETDNGTYKKLINLMATSR